MEKLEFKFKNEDDQVVENEDDLKTNIQEMIEYLFQIKEELNQQDKIEEIISSDAIPPVNLILDDPDNFYRQLPPNIYNKLDQQFDKLRLIFDRSKKLKVYQFAKKLIQEENKTDVNRFENNKDQILTIFIDKYQELINRLPIDFKLIISKNLLDQHKNLRQQNVTLIRMRDQLIEDLRDFETSTTQIITSQYSNDKISQVLLPVLEDISKKLSDIEAQISSNQKIINKIGKETETKTDNNTSLCKICFDQPIEFALGCGHTFCHVCINSIQNYRMNSTFYLCPNCREKTHNEPLRLYF